MCKTNLISSIITSNYTKMILFARDFVRRLIINVLVFKAKIKKLLKISVVEPSASPFASPNLLVKNGKIMRLWIDKQKLNSVIKKDAHLLPRIDNIFDTLTCSKYLTTLHLTMWFHKVSASRWSRANYIFNSVRTFWLLQDAFWLSQCTSDFNATHNNGPFRNALNYILVNLDIIIFKRNLNISISNVLMMCCFISKMLGKN